MKQESPSLKALTGAWVGLMVLLLLTAGSSSIPMGSFNLIANLAIATAKMLLVMFIFMHLGYGRSLMRVFAFGGFFWLALLIGLSLSDYVTRSTVPSPF